MKSQKVRWARSVLLGAAVLSLGVATARAQVANGSFEQDGQFSTAGWEGTDPACLDAVKEAPPGGGAWALKLHMINLQGGCFGVAYQVMPQVQDGDIWRLTAWARAAAGGGAAARLYWTTFVPIDSSGLSPYLPEPVNKRLIDTTLSDQWTQLSVVDTVFVAPGDSVGIVLSAGVTSGPTRETDFVYFDLISVEKVGNFFIQTGDDEQPEAPAFTSASNFPNPFTASTTISFTLQQPHFVSLDIYDLLGRKVDTLIDGSLSGGTHTVVWDAGDLPDGIYVGRLRAGSQVQTVKLVLLR